MATRVLAPEPPSGVSVGDPARPSALARLVPPRVRQWLFQTGRSDSPPFVLGQRRIFILPARVGLLFGIVLCVMYAGAVNYNLGLGHALVFLLASLGLTALVHSFRNLFGLSVAPGRVPPVFAGNTARFSILFENDRAEQRPALRLRAGRQGALIRFDLPASTGMSVELPVPTVHRGWMELERLSLSTTFPLGLFFAWSNPRLAMRCVVFPKPLPYPFPPMLAGLRPGRRDSAAGDDDFAGLRLRQPGDSPRHIAWKSFARDPEHRPLQVKQFAGGQEAEVWFSWYQLPQAMDIETRLSVLTGWVLAAEAEGSRYGLRLPTQEFPPGAGDAHRLQCLTALALFGLDHDVRTGA